MPKKTLTLIGLILILSELSGMPHPWKTAYGVAVGLALIILAFWKGQGSEDSPGSVIRNSVSHEETTGHVEGEQEKSR